MAEIVQKRRHAELLDRALFKGEMVVEATVETAEKETCSCGCGGESKSDEVIELAVLQPATAVPIALPTKVTAAIDPICGMTVDIATARYTFTHEDTIYYFCCAGCQSAFVKEKA
jgi:YHS domain-containing protein